jgi:hypothetical protein
MFFVVLCVFVLKFKELNSGKNWSDYIKGKDFAQRSYVVANDKPWTSLKVKIFHGSNYVACFASCSGVNQVDGLPPASNLNSSGHLALPSVLTRNCPRTAANVSEPKVFDFSQTGSWQICLGQQIGVIIMTHTERSYGGVIVMLRHPQAQSNVQEDYLIPTEGVSVKGIRMLWQLLARDSWGSIWQLLSWPTGEWYWCSSRGLHHRFALFWIFCNFGDPQEIICSTVTR